MSWGRSQFDNSHGHPKNTDSVGRRVCKGACHAVMIEDIGMGIAV